MRTNFNRLSKPEVDFLIDNCSFSEDENIILIMTSHGSTNIQIAEKLNISVSGIEKKKRNVREKILAFLEVSNDMTTIYVNGKRVTKEELQKHEINIKKVKDLLSEKLTKKK